MKKTLLTILIATSISSVYAEGNHKGGHGHDGAGEGHHGGGAHWMSPAGAAEKPNPIKPDSISVERGKKAYFQYCSSCHGAKAMGDGPVAASLNPKPANLVVMSGGHPDGDFAWKIANGRGSMPAWKSLLNENQIWDLVNYIQQLNPNGKLMDMSKMDHSNMSEDDMKKMMMSMGSMEGQSEHSDTDGHHAAKPKVESHHDDGEKGHSH